MLAELTREKGAVIKGKDVMTFDDYQYVKANEFVLDLPLTKTKKMLK